MKKNKSPLSWRSSIILRRHSRANIILRSIFMGWGLIFVLILATSPLIYRNLLMNTLDIIDLSGIEFDQFRVSNGDFKGLDNKNNPFEVKARKIRQTFEKPDDILLETVYAKFIQENGGKVPTKVWANSGEYNKVSGLLVLTGDVRVDSENGDKIRTKKMSIQLKPGKQK